MPPKAERLRDFLNQRKQAQPSEIPSPTAWQALIEAAELTPDDLALLAKQVDGHKARARKAAFGDRDDDFVFEALQALLLDPFDAEFADDVASQLERRPWTGEDLEALRQRLRAVRKTPPKGLPWWVWIVGAGFVSAAGLLAALLLWAPWTSAVAVAPAAVSQSSRPLEVTLDTLGAKTTIVRAESDLSLYAESAVLSLHLLLDFPTDRVGAWNASLLVLDSNGAVVHEQSLTLRSKSEGELEPGQGFVFDQQFDASGWHEKAAKVAVQSQVLEAVTTDIKALTAMTVDGKGSLSDGHDFQVFLRSSVWKERFATKVNDLTMELRNSGLKPFRELTFRLDWMEGTTVLRSVTLKAVSQFRSDLPSGGHLALVPQTEFETEIFRWPVDSPPRPRLTLESWK